MHMPVMDLAIALLIGALVGIEREKKKEDAAESGTPGLRTFILIAIAGAIAGWLSLSQATPWIFIAAGAFVTVLVLSTRILYAHVRPKALGLTTEIAAVVVYLLGGLTLYGYRSEAVMLGIVVSAVLAYKQPLHHLVEKIGREDLYAGLKLLIATFIVLPVLPNRPVDPWGALNPNKIWWLVILISGLSLIGYVATRWLGPKRGITITGLCGGLVSSTAVTLSFARRSKEADAQPLANALAAGLLLAWMVMFGRIIAIVAMFYPPMLGRLLIPMLILGLLSAAVAGLLLRLHLGSSAIPDGHHIPLKNPFSLISAIKFALFFAAVLLLVKLAQHHLPGQSGVYTVAALAGLTDVNAISLSMAQYARDGSPPDVAVNAITLAAVANTLTKCGLAMTLGAAPFARRVTAATLILLATAASLWLLF